MKKFIKTLVLAVMAGVSFTSCSKSEIAPEEPETPEKVKVSIRVWNYNPTLGYDYVIVINEGTPTEMVKEGGEGGGYNDPNGVKKHDFWIFETDKSETIKTIKVYSTGEGNPDWALFELSFIHPVGDGESYAFYEKTYPELFAQRYNWTR